MSRDTNKELEMLSRVHEPLDVFFLRRRGGGVLVCLRAAARGSSSSPTMLIARTVERAGFAFSR